VPTAGIAIHEITFSLVVYFLTLLTLAAFLASRVYAAVERLRKALATRRRFAELAPAELHAGPVELTGTVETDPPNRPAVTVRLRQHAVSVGVARSPMFEWKEQERSVEARPFTLVLHDGRLRVEVLPGERPHLLARSELTPTAPQERDLTASLRHGERARVTGVLAMTTDDDVGYREAPRRFVLTAQEGERLRIEAESATLGRDDAAAARRRASEKGRGIILIACGAPAAWTTLTLAQSTTVTATVTDAGTCTGRTKNGTYKYACYGAVAPDGRTRFNDLHGQATVGAPVRISFAPDFPSRFERGETLSPDQFSAMFMGVFGFFLALLLLADFVVGRSGREPRWYDVEPFDIREAP
jgi:hypothetical protein